MAFNSAGNYSRFLAAVLGTLTLPAGALCQCGVLRTSFAFVPSGAYAGMHSGGQGYLGVALRGIDDPTVTAWHLKESRGVAVVMVDHDSPAWKAGIRERDVVLSVNSTTAENEEQLRRMLRELRPGRNVQIVISRDGNQQTLNATMANGDDIGRQAWENRWVVPAPPDASPEESSPPQVASRPPRGFAHGFVGGHLLPQFGAYTGAMVNEIEPQLAEYFGLKGTTGLLVHSVDPNSPAATAGLHAGDVVTRLNGNPVASRGDWNKALHDSKGHPVSLTVMRDHHEQVLVMVPDAKRRSSLEETGPPPEKPRWLAVLLSRSSFVP